MAVPPHHMSTLMEILEAAEESALAVMECTEKKTGKTVYVVGSVGLVHTGKGTEFHSEH